MKNTGKHKNMRTKVAYSLFVGTIAVFNIDAQAMENESQKKQPVVSNSNSQNLDSNPNFIQLSDSIRSIDGINPDKQKEVALLQENFVKIMIEYIKDNSSNPEEYAKLIRYWVAPKSKTDKTTEAVSGMIKRLISLPNNKYKEKSIQPKVSDMTRKDIEAQIPALQQLTSLLDQIQEHGTGKKIITDSAKPLVSSLLGNIGNMGIKTNTNTANKLADWVSSELCQIALEITKKELQKKNYKKAIFSAIKQTLMKLVTIRIGST